ncbi:hypothetical protein ACRYI5_03445 [Furfurilactobacillus sp. WILCCON 0119]
MTDDEKLAHDKALAFAQATLLDEIADANKNRKHGTLSISEKANVFNYSYAESFNYFLQEGNTY